MTQGSDITKGKEQDESMITLWIVYIVSDLKLIFVNLINYESCNFFMFVFL